MADVVALKRDMVGPQVRAEHENGILRLTLDNPPANVLSLAMMAAVQSELDAAREEKAVRVIVIAAAGKLFSGGHDLKEMTAHRNDPDRGRGFFEHTFAMCSRMMQGIVGHPKPVIAEVDGVATAAGCQLVASCDLAIASDRSKFAVNGINAGLFCSTPGVALGRAVHPKHAMEMLLTGEMIDAPTAREIGLINRVVPAEYLTQVTNKYAQTIAAKSPLTLKLGKAAFYVQVGMGLAEAYEHASRVMVENMLARDAEEGIDAFISKRKPEWTGE